MSRAATAARAATFLLLVMALAAGCIRLISAEQLEDGSAVMCARIEPTPTPDAGAHPSAAPAMRYAPVHAPAGAVATPAPSSAPASTGAP